MTRLFHAERGFCHYLQYEAVAASRVARTVLTLPDAINAGGTLYLLCKPFSEVSQPLRVNLNGREMLIPAGPSSCLAWQMLPVDRDALRPGENVIEVRCDGGLAEGWALAMESGYAPAASRLSLDGGRTWRGERMGIGHASSGEYLVRLRVDDPALADPAPPAFRWEDPEATAFDAVRAAIPAEVRAIADPWEQARALAAWTSTQWTYRNTGKGVEYAPWDALAILAWGRAERGFVHKDPIVMCVHFGIVFTTCALALGLPARNICCKGSGLHDGGHFISEVWSERWGKWCQVDGNTDVVYQRDGVPLSVEELAGVGAAAAELAVTGPGYAAQSDYIKNFVRDYMLTGWVYQHWAVWPRNDYLTHPEETPPSHGSPEYSEIDWQWAEPAQQHEHLGMFPHRLSAETLRAAPPAAWREKLAVRA